MAEAARMWLSVKEAADRLGVHPNWVYRRLGGEHGDTLPFYRRGHLIRIPAEEFAQWAQQKVIG